MSDIGSGTPQRDVDKIIKEALKVWEEFGFKDMSFWETFQDDFEGFTAEDFKSASTHHQRKLRDYLRKYGVWVRKQQRYTIARSLYDALLEEEPTDWTEAEIMACKPREEFASYYIKQLLDSDFGRKPQMSTTGPPPAPAPLASPSPTPGPSPPVPAYTPIHPTQPSGIGPTPETYGTPAALGTPAPYTSGTGPTRGAYMQPSGSTSAAYIQPSGPTSAAYIQPLGPTSAMYGIQQSGGRPAAYMQLSGTGPTPAVNATLGVHNQPEAYTPISGTGPTFATAHTQSSGTRSKLVVHTQQSSTGPAHAVQNYSSAIKPPAITTARTGHTPTSALGPSAAATLSASAPLASSTAFPNPSAPAPVDSSPIYPTQPSSTGAKPAVHTQISSIGPTHAVDTQPSSTGPAHTVQTPPSAINPPVAMTPISTEHAFLVDPQPVVTPTSTGPGSELSNLAEIYNNEATYSSWKNSFIFQLANSWKDALNSLSKSFRMGRTSRRDSFQTTKWMKWDKTKDEMDETRAGVG